MTTTRQGASPLLLTRRIEFSASHRLWRADWDDARNAAAFGARSARAERGHNYVLEVTLDGPVDAETGMVIDLKHVKDVVEREISARFDHKQLNADTPWFRERAPTAENFARVIFDLLDAAFPGRLLSSVRLWPTPDWFVEVAR